MRTRQLSANNRRLRWALAIALALHAVLLWFYAPQFLARFEASQLLPVSVPAPQPVEQIIEITPPAPPPRKRGIELATRLGGGSPEALQPELPPDFFPKPTPLGNGRLNLSDDLDFARASGAQIVANIIPAATRMANLSLVDGRVRRLKPKPIRPTSAAPARTTALAPIAPVTASAAASVGTVAEAPVPIQSTTPQQPLSARATPAQAVLLDTPQLRADEPPPQPPAPIQLQPQPPLEEPTVLSEESFVPEDTTAVPFLLPPPPPVVEDLEDLNVDAAIEQAARAAAQSARVAHSSSTARAAPDYRAMLPQGPLVAAPPLPLGGDRVIAPAPRESSITTYALEAPSARRPPPPTVEQQKAAAVARKQFFAELTARLKATNQRLLAEALKAGPRTTVQMRFLIDREGRVIEMGPVEPGNRLLAERAMAVIRAAALPRVPDSMTQLPVELSFPVEVYR
ncbi:MAG: hypothetical protein V4650_06225 [Pseudomonadota bacterium]